MIQTFGEGERVVLLHAVGTPLDTWREQLALADRYQLILTERRGYGDQGLRPPEAPDLEADAEEAALLLEDGAHLVGFCMGGVIALRAASLRPWAVRSLTLVEPSAFDLAPASSDARRMMADMTPLFPPDRGLSPEEFDVRFVRAMGLPYPTEPMSPAHRRRIQSQMRERVLPWEADLPIDLLAAQAFRTLVVSGDWSPAFEAVCDVLKERLSAERAFVPGYAHMPQLAGEVFNEVLERFWASTR